VQGRTVDSGLRTHPAAGYTATHVFTAGQIPRYALE